jgi:hypothetical protein
MKTIELSDEDIKILNAIIWQVNIPSSIAKQVSSLQEKIKGLVDSNGDNSKENNIPS